MIRKIIVLDKDSGLGFDLYDDKSIKVDSSLLSGLVGALLLFTGTLSSDLDFKRADIGTLRISVSNMNGVQYVAFSDIFDNFEFVTSKLMEVINLVCKDLTIDTLFSWIPDKEIEEKIKRILISDQFPIDKLPETYQLIDELIAEGIEFETLLLGDLDDGIIHVYLGNREKVTLLMEIMSQLPIETSWIGESSAFQRNDEIVKEILLISRLGSTDFFLLGQAVIQPDAKDETIKRFNAFNQKIFKLLMKT
ncbi:MAG: hypothetical protein D6732_01805 [Methanobacteriota archaeon]|nr:MAG: hypothetical protein D6732_01805 [Euryarchaeota archaeon]